MHVLLTPILQSSSRLVVELEAFAARCVDQAAAVGAPLALVLLLCEALALGDNQLCVRAVGVVVGNVGVAGKLGEDLDVGLDALEAVFDVAALLVGLLLVVVALALVGGCRW